MGGAQSMTSAFMPSNNALLNEGVDLIAAVAKNATSGHSIDATTASAVAMKFAAAIAEMPYNDAILGHGSDFDSIIESLRVGMALRATIPQPGHIKPKGMRPMVPESPPKTPRTLRFIDNPSSPWHP